MGTLNRPGNLGASSPFGPSIQEYSPGHGIGDHGSMLSDADIARLIAADPSSEEDEACLISFREASRVSSRELTQDEWAQLSAGSDTIVCLESIPPGFFEAVQDLEATESIDAAAGAGAQATLDETTSPVSGALTVDAALADSEAHVGPAVEVAGGPRVTASGWPNRPRSVAVRASRLKMLPASVPDLPEAPREENPVGVHWSPTAGADALAGLDPVTLSDNDLLDYLHAANRLASFARAMEDFALTEFATRRPPLAGECLPPAEADGAGQLSKWAAGEIMAVYALGQGASLHKMTEAGMLVNDLPETFALHREGLLDSVRVEAILHGVIGLPPMLRGALEPLFLPGASRMNPATLTRKIRKLADAHNPEPLAARHERASRERRVWFTPLDDGMAQLGAILPAVPAKALFDSLSVWARNAQREGRSTHAITPTGRPSRSLNNYMADCLLDLLHETFLHPCQHSGDFGGFCCTGGTNCAGGADGARGSDGAGGASCGCCTCGAGFEGGSPKGSAAGSSQGQEAPRQGPAPRTWVPASVSIEVPALTLLGRSEEAGMLEGYGPIPPDQARELSAGSAAWFRILTHPEKRTRISVGRSRYRPPPDMARLVRLQEPACTGIGCDVPASKCELDHTIPFYMNKYGPDGALLPKGETSVANLMPRSQYCHLLKDDPTTGWSVEPDGPGVTKTTTPTGRVYRHIQDDDPAPF
ncbi:MAG: DUF222 domain-containing protein [Specibacter sp.]